MDKRLTGRIAAIKEYQQNKEDDTRYDWMIMPGIPGLLIILIIGSLVYLGYITQRGRSVADAQYLSSAFQSAQNVHESGRMKQCLLGQVSIPAQDRRLTRDEVDTCLTDAQRYADISLQQSIIQAH